MAGFVDSIAGGGGLITLPTLAIAVGAGPEAIGTNKIGGACAAAAALAVYARRGHVNWGRSTAFTAWVAAGSFTGSWVAPLLPAQAFRVLLLLSCPLILWIVWKKDLWISREFSVRGPSASAATGSPLTIALSGALCGFYDGVWGPGGGTFMFLSLLFFAHFPLLEALGTAKFANLFSAGSALIGYAVQGHIHAREGLLMAAAVSVGAFFGARHATRRASRIVRPVLATVTILLLLRALQS